MRSVNSNWFECKVQYDTVTENGSNKKVSELYAVDAVSFTEAEKIMIDEMSYYIKGDFEVSDIKKAKYKEVFFSDIESADRYYKVKLQFITIDEKTAKEKRTNVMYLVQAENIKDALKNLDEVMKTSLSDYESVEIKETKIFDAIEYRERNSTRKDV